MQRSRQKCSEPAGSRLNIERSEDLVTDSLWSRYREQIRLRVESERVNRNSRSKVSVPTSSLAICF